MVPARTWWEFMQWDSPYRKIKIEGTDGSSSGEKEHSLYLCSWKHMALK